LQRLQKLVKKWVCLNKRILAIKKVGNKSIIYAFQVLSFSSNQCIISTSNETLYFDAGRSSRIICKYHLLRQHEKRLPGQQTLPAEKRNLSVADLIF
jgi:hypothetical protein